MKIFSPNNYFRLYFNPHKKKKLYTPTLLCNDDDDDAVATANRRNADDKNRCNPSPRRQSLILQVTHSNEIPFPAHDLQK